MIMKTISLLLICVAAIIFAGCATKRKIQIYDFNKRKVVMTLDNVSQGCDGREIPEFYPDFRNKTFSTCQRFTNHKMTILRKYTFKGTLLESWEIPEQIYPDHNFSIRGNYFFYVKLSKDLKGNIKDQLMMYHLPSLKVSGQPTSLSLPSQSLATLHEPPFVVLTNETLLCLMEPNDDASPLQLWKVSLTGERVRLPYSVERLGVKNCLSSDISGRYHAIQTGLNEVLFVGNDANVLARLSVDFPIRKTWWDDNHCYWVYDYLSGSYLCYDVGTQCIKKYGQDVAWDIKGNEWRIVRTFLEGQCTIVRKRFGMGFLRTKVQNKGGATITTLPWLSSRRYGVFSGNLYAATLR